MLIVEHHGGVLLLTLDRPKKRNSLHPELIARLESALQEAEASSDIAVLVLTGQGPAFCAGLDLHHLAELDAAARVAYMRRAFDLFEQVYHLRQPVIAAVNGPAIAGGFDLAAFSDLRFCSADATFAQTEILLGLTQIVYPIYKSIGVAKAKELALSGMTIAADEALRIGLVNRVYPAEELQAETLRFAEMLAQRPAQALFETKRLTREMIEVDTAGAMRRMFDTIATRLDSAEHARALENYLAGLRRRRELT